MPGLKAPKKTGARYVTCVSEHPLIARLEQQPTLWLFWYTDEVFNQAWEIYFSILIRQPLAEDNKKSINGNGACCFSFCQYVYRSIGLIIYYPFLIDIYFYRETSKRFCRCDLCDFFCKVFFMGIMGNEGCFYFNLNKEKCRFGFYSFGILKKISICNF